jgi:hypothetical protein
MGVIFTLLLYFSICGFFAVTEGYDFFHAKNPSGIQGFFFLIFGGGTLFFGLHLINAFTDPPPAWYTYFLPTSFREPETDRPKRLLFIAYASIYVMTMTFLISLRLGFSLERIALPLAIGLLAVLLLTSLLRPFAAFYMIWKNRKTSSSADKA